MLNRQRACCTRPPKQQRPFFCGYKSGFLSLCCFYLLRVWNSIPLRRRVLSSHVLLRSIPSRHYSSPYLRLPKPLPKPLLHLDTSISTLTQSISYHMLSATDPSPMSSAEVAAHLTPLLPRTKSPPHAHLIFYRLCHSSWSSINQRVLIETRGFLAIYMTAILALELASEILNRERGRDFIFLLSNFSYAIQTAYYWMTFVSPINTPRYLPPLKVFWDADLVSAALLDSTPPDGAYRWRGQRHPRQGQVCAFDPDYHRCE